ncbi:hypothetical protein [Hymenobacter cellulosivorans]|uniref:Lipoprotein n=1 Tax=Hymenobacter cellulosivorans TaxID=2932249 RepID=A0ABY4F474_9BACT|nr:hypothetical protein [Hymenobacter cellulosivorans]UOQ50867.1 hypothetical protein MUN80_13975 [Hymenobacter cellulosivorans]
MKYLFLAPVLLSLASCQSTPNADVATTEPATPAPATTEQASPASAAAEAANPEYIEANTITVNGKARAELSTKLLTSQMGRPDSIAKGAVECGGELETADNTNGDFWYYGNTTYEVAGDQAILTIFDVTTGKFQGRVGQLVLNQNTTLEDVRRYYPVSAKEADKPSTSQPGEVMSLGYSYKGAPIEGALSLIFKQGKLQRVEFFYPC